MFQRATGWLGYTPREALESNVNDLEAALTGRMEMMKMLFGDGGKGGSDDGPTAPVTAERFRAMAARHNAGRKRG